MSETGTPSPTPVDLPRERVSERYEIIRRGGGAPTTTICDSMRFEHPADLPAADLDPAEVLQRVAGSHAQGTGSFSSKVRTIRSEVISCAFASH